MTEVPSRITDQETIRELVTDFDELLGLGGNFWKGLSSGEEMAKLDSPEQVQELAKDLLVNLFGLEVRGL